MDALTFRSDLRPIIRLCVTFGFYAMVFFLLAAALGQYRAGRFPSYSDLALAAGLAPLMASALAFVLWVASLIYVVRVLPTGLRCYDLMCCYRTVLWSNIESVQPMTVYGMPYLLVGAAGLKRPLTVPLWLEHLKRFADVVNANAGADNPLSKALREVT